VYRNFYKFKGIDEPNRGCIPGYYRDLLEFRPSIAKEMQGGILLAAFAFTLRRLLVYNYHYWPAPML
jgi:hypothetical protein